MMNGAKEKSRKQSKFLELNELSENSQQKLWDTLKAVLSGAYIKRSETAQVNDSKMQPRI